MSGHPDELDVDGVHCFPAADGDLAFQYVPGEPVPERDPQGRPTISLWMIPPRPMLQLGTRWEVTPDQLQKIRSAIQERSPGADSRAIQLSPSLLRAERVQVSMGDGAGTLTVVASSASSGFPPYQAVFSLRLDPDQAAWAAAALNGGRSHLQVTYHGQVMRSIPVEVRIVGDVSDDLAGLRADATEEDAAARVAGAIVAGRLTLTRSETEGAPDAVWTQLEQQVRTKAARDLLALARRLDSSPAGTSFPSITGNLQDSVSTTYEESVDIVRSTDVGTWFAAGDGAEHIHVIGTTETSTR